MNKEILLRAKREIEALRRENEILQAKNEVIQIFGQALFHHPNGGGSMSVDIAWELQREFDDLSKSDEIK